MKALTSPDVRALHAIALGDKRLNKPDRMILAEVARTGTARNPAHLAKIAGLKSPAASTARVEKLRNLGYLPADTRPASTKAGL